MIFQQLRSLQNSVSGILIRRRHPPDSEVLNLAVTMESPLVVINTFLPVFHGIQYEYAGSIFFIRKV